MCRSGNYSGKTVLQNSTPKQLKKLRAVRTETTLSPQSCSLWGDNSCTRDTASSFREAGTAASQAASEQRTTVQGPKVYEGKKEVEALIPALFAFFSPSILLTQNQSAICREPHHMLVTLTGVCSNARGLVNLQKTFIHFNFFFFFF